MKPDTQLMLKITDLTLRYMNGKLDQEGLHELEGLLKTNPLAVEYYTEVIWTHVGLNAMEGILSLQKAEDMFDQNVWLDQSVWLDRNVWLALAEHEKNAPAIHIEKQIEETREPCLVQATKPKRTISKLSIYSLVLSAAAVLLLLVMILIRPVRPIVATLTDSINAEWISKNEIPAVNDVLREGELTLAKGLAEITFYDGAVVVVEAPAIIELESSKSMFVTSGKISALVSEYAIGFMVNTPSGSIVDLGTEFGVAVEGDGSCSLHMFKGRANLVAGKEGQRKVAQRVHANEARAVDISTGQIQIKTLEKDTFARYIDSQSGLIWRGRHIDLADIIGNGNGFGSGRDTCSINLATGKYYQRTLSGMQITDYKYHSCDELPFVDGVFAPDGGENLVQVTSEGHLWKGCPDTTGKFYEGIFTGSRTNVVPVHGFVLNGLRYGTAGHPAIVTHCNAGVTFDLAAIRPTLSDLKITSFEALCGVSQEAGNQCPGNVSDFFVLVDGEKRFEAKGIGVVSEPVEISIELSQEDRFLTLVSTDGDMRSNHDWSFYAEPKLILE